MFFSFSGPWKKLGPDGPKWGQDDFFLLIQTLPTFWAEWILSFRIFIFRIFLAPSLGPSLGPGLGPGLGLGLGPGLGLGLGPGPSRAWARAWGQS